MKFAHLLCAAVLIPLAACSSPADKTETEAKTETAPKKPEWASDGMTSRDGETAAADDVARPEMQLQVVLDRLGFSPGVVDGKMGASTTNALKGFQEANGLKASGEADEATKAALAKWQAIPATRVVKIPASYAEAAVAALPEKASEQAKLAAMGYESTLERLAERFHTTPDVLKSLNPEAAFAAPAATEGATPPAVATGTTLRVPNVGADHIVAAEVDNADWLTTLGSLGVGTDQPAADRIEVSKKAGTMKVFDAGEKLIALFTVTTGSAHDPLPIGKWKVKGVGRNPDYAFDPALLRGVAASEGKHRLPPGPNNPVGVVWIDLNKEHYGLHGTPEPQNIGHTESNGCVRLTNWDAARLAQMVAVGTKVDFVA